MHSDGLIKQTQPSKSGPLLVSIQSCSAPWGGTNLSFGRVKARHYLPVIPPAVAPHKITGQQCGSVKYDDVELYTSKAHVRLVML